MKARLASGIESMQRRILERKLRSIVFVVIILFLVALLSQIEIKYKEEATASGDTRQGSGVVNPFKGKSELPETVGFRTVAETDILILKVHPDIGHFMVVDKRSGHVWHSYPEPSQWENRSIGGIWKDHMRSPIMVESLDFSSHNAQPKYLNWISEDGAIENFEPMDGGVRLTYVMSKVDMRIPIEIRLQDDYVETKIVDAGIEEGNRFGILSIRLFPFLGAEQNLGQEGYMFVPDGNGAIIEHNQKIENQSLIYHESVYGKDYSYQTGASDRRSVVMPVFGYKTGNHAYLAVIEDGEEYAEVFASPTGVYSSYSWVAADMKYRSPYKQVISESKNRFYIAYDEENRFHSDRTIRYYFLDGEKATYSGMAECYRNYLMNDKGYSKMRYTDDAIPMHVTLVGGDRVTGVFPERYQAATTTDQAMQIVQRYRDLGIENMAIHMLGWQEDGFISLGKNHPVDKRLGGNEGMENFVRYAHSLNMPVTYGVNYVLNNGGAHDFSQRYHGMRDYSGTFHQYTDLIGDSKLPVASHKFVLKYLEDDLRAIKELGVDGITFGGGYGFGSGVGNMLNTDFNTRYGSTRTEAMELQREMFSIASGLFDQVNGTDTGMYVNDKVSHMFEIKDDYSYDLFSTRSVPFLQIAMHGLISYSSSYMNDRFESESQFLRDIEYGMNPSIILTYEDADALRFSSAFYLFNSSFRDWEKEAVREYQRYNSALSDVQALFITDHRQLAMGVYQTTYENGKRIIVNHNNSDYTKDGVNVAARNFVAIGGGKQ